jgi:succinate dehydrogenase / fumarate reductase cytochrome b subunit
MIKSIIRALKSQVGRKVLSSVTGLFFLGFVLLHLAANLLILPGPHAFNTFNNGFDSLGWFRYALEIVLAIGIVLHMYIGTSVWLRRQKKRPTGYKKYRSKGGPSHMNWLSRGMFYTGIIIFAFLCWHVLQLRFGNTGMVLIHGHQVEDLKALVVSTFLKPWNTAAYAFVMVALGFHLFHGLWSSFKSLSMKEGGFSTFMYGFGIFFAAVIAIGFFFIPLFIYFNGGA